ncbi:hypothetical protein M885DRAFT_150503 [Pelagophyceae sp. CCMP2097]|nr:hypothetical protein M885DRAFT_150503 [Pelagophyceae sp. CCMP2097]
MAPPAATVRGRRATVERATEKVCSPCQWLVSWRERWAPAAVLGADVFLASTLWLLAASVIFYFTTRKDELHSRFTPLYCLYYSINVGFGVGSAPYKPRTTSALAFECVHCTLGMCVVVGGLGSYFRLVADVSRRRKVHADGDGGTLTPRGGRRGSSHLTRFGIAYVLCVVTGMLIGRFVAGFTTASDLLLFSITNLTTAGLLVGEPTQANWLAQSCFLFVGVPVASLFFAEVCSKIFVYHRKRHVAARERRDTARRSDTTSDAGSVASRESEHEADIDASHTSHASLDGSHCDASHTSHTSHAALAALDAAPDCTPAAGATVRFEEFPVAEGDAVARAEFQGWATVRYASLRRERWYAFRDGFDASTQLAVDLVGIVCIWIMVGALFYYCMERRNSPHWSVSYATYYAVNVGLGVGSAGRDAARRTLSDLFTCCFCMAGHMLIVGGVGAAYRVYSERARRLRTWRRGPHWLKRLQQSHLPWLVEAYALIGALGVVQGYYAAGFRDSMDLAVYAITNMSTAGLLTSNNGERPSRVGNADGLLAESILAGRAPRTSRGR